MIDAKEAREKTKQAEVDLSEAEEELKELESEINNNIVKGRYHVTHVGILHKTTKKVLKQLKYKIYEDYGFLCNYTTIKW